MKAFGISALVLSIVAIFLPIIGVFLAGLSGALAIVAAGSSLTLGLSAVIINIVNIIFLSPSLIIAASHQSSSTADTSFSTAFGILLTIQIVAVLVFVGVGIKGYFRDRA